MSRRRRWEMGWPSGNGARLALQIVAVAVAGFAIGYLVMALFVFSDSAADQIVTVPDLREMTLEAATRRAEADDLTVEVGDSLSHPTIPAGAVLAHSPLPGQEVTPGTPIRVLISVGRERRQIPDLSGLRGAGAERVLRAAGFDVTVVEEEDSLPAGRVIDVDPPPGTALPLPARVVLRLSSGPPLLAVPDVLGLSENGAVDLLLSNGFEPVVEFTFYWRRPAGEVVSQSPVAGDSLPAGDTVRINVSTDRLRDFRPRR